MKVREIRCVDIVIKRDVYAYTYLLYTHLFISNMSSC